MTDLTDAPMPTPTAAASPAVAVKRPRTVFAGYTASQLSLGLALLGLLVWGMWVTRALTSTPPPQHIVKADLSRIVGDYVQAQSRSATPPEQVRAQMQQFMASLDNELQRRGAKGQVVLVGEAVLSKSVPDITPDVMKAVYASGVRRPQPATAAEMSRMLGAMPQGPVPGQPVTAQVQQVPQFPAAPTASAAPVEYAPAPISAPAEQSYNAAPAGPSVSTFGGLIGAGGQ